MAQGTGNGFKPKSQRALIAAGLVAVSIIGAIDYYCPTEMSFEIIYLLPIMFVTWRGGNRAGVVIAIASAVAWLVLDLAQATPGTEPFMYWNAISGLFVFVMVVFLLAAVKSLNASLESKVEQRTGELQASFWELQQTKARLRTSEERFRQLAEGIHDVFWMTDLDNGQVVYVSPEYEKVWGRTCASWFESPGTRLEAVHPEDRERVRQFAGNNASRAGYDEEFRIVRPDGAVRWVRERAFPIPDRTGKVYRLAGIAEDITSRKPLEKRARDAAASA